MPGWKALPEELDPEVRAFTELIRRLIDRSGLGVAAVAERTGHERASWYAYLNARQPMPRGAVTALAEVTGADPADLVGRWERARGRFAAGASGGGGPEGGGPEGAGPGAERPGLSGGSERPGLSGGSERAGLSGGSEWPDAPGGHDRPGLPDEPGNDSTMQIRRLDPERPAKAPGSVPDSVLAPGSGPEPAGSPGLHPAPPPGLHPAPPPGLHPAPPRDLHPAPPRDLHPAPPRDRDRGQNQAPTPAPSPGEAPAPAPARSPRKTPLLLYVAGILGALLVVTAALLLVDLGGGGTDGGADGRASAPPTTPAPSPTSRTELPAGVKCSGADCAGRDPEAMGCGGPLAVTVARVRVGTAGVEVRHSATCSASWARITGAAPGDTVSVEVAGATERATVPEGADTAAAETDAYTPMLAVTPRAAARACGTLADGTRACTAGR
ncbi:helix-turn-helix domain-containing protein [Streptomyces cinereoruber]|uniref:helix-turn-helix domain-containing protein n=1 Tax=Streptomyces cinereoruber TaxID=67260 RepID=UPI003640FBEA